MSGEEDEVRQASKQFYTSLTHMANGDAASLAQVWSHGTSVTAMHPIGGRQVGWDAVRESFDKVAEMASDGKVGLQDQLIRVVGDVGYEMGTERGEFKMAGQKITLDHRVTNIYRKEGGAWKVVHHHADVAPAMLDVLKQ